MGLYLNPLDMTKEAWLIAYATRVTAEELVSDYQTIRDDGFIPVVLVNNGPFTAAAIGYSLGETLAFCDNQDPRQRAFYKAPIAELKNIQSPEFHRLMANYGVI